MWDLAQAWVLFSATSARGIGLDRRTLDIKPSLQYDCYGFDAHRQAEALRVLVSPRRSVLRLPRFVCPLPLTTGPHTAQALTITAVKRLELASH
ncbi:hypothetical protein FB567DRAFT_210249 [Paraphoma chrysanthemicola]|uniref:Uncharacterized protein n=1 Tax=Paraphoma chrysanthemicola TaxID=798071 RepID=A0A8K0QWI3_9PLEO|nr:hypothetical protein FB567DRAFT_210249 [Paraphoma chrysanthemicola]